MAELNPSAGTPALGPVPTTAVDPDRLAGLCRYNVVVGLILLVQALAVVALSNDFTLPSRRPT